MKPTRNTIFCHGCQRTKMLFETKAKADNFIRFNSEGIQEENGKAPVRSYYCGICGGYHVTSNPSATEGEKMDSRDRQRVENFTRQKREREEAKALAKAVSDRLDRIKTLLRFGRMDEAEDLLDVCYLDLEEIDNYPLTAYSKLPSLRRRVEKAKELLIQVREVLGLPEQEQHAFISQLPRDRNRFSLFNILRHNLRMRRMESLLQQAEALLDEGKTDVAAQIINKCKQLVVNIAATDKNETTKDANTRIREMELRIKLLAEKETVNICKSEVSTKTTGDERITEKHVHETTDVRPKKMARSKEYVSTILLLINKLEQIQKAYGEGDYDNCESLVEIVSFILDDLDPRDENVKTVTDQLDKWKQRLGMTS